MNPRHEVPEWAKSLFTPEFLDELYKCALHWARQFGLQDADSRDVAQQAITARLSKGDTSEIKCNQTYCFGIIRNLCLEIVREKAKMKMKSLEQDQDVASRDSIESKGLFAEVNRLLDGLDEDDRAILQMHYLDRLKYREIAEKLGENENTVRARASRSSQITT